MFFGLPSVLKLGRLFGIPIKVHISLIALLGLLALLGGQSFGAAGLLLAVFLFGSVLAHELGHSLVARRLGVPISNITLYPFGGMARMTRMPRSAKDEIWISAAGPLLSLILALAFYLLAPLAMVGSPLRFGAFRLAEINLILGLFNLAPALPMDGGRILRALLSLKYGFKKATLKAASAARLVGWGFVALSLVVGNFWLIFVAVVVMLLARKEAAMTQMGLTPGYSDQPFSSSDGAYHAPFGHPQGNGQGAEGWWSAYRQTAAQRGDDHRGTSSTRVQSFNKEESPAVHLPSDKVYTVVKRADGSVLIHVEKT